MDEAPSSPPNLRVSRPRPSLIALVFAVSLTWAYEGHGHRLLASLRNTALHLLVPPPPAFYLPHSLLPPGCAFHFCSCTRASPCAPEGPPLRRPRLLPAEAVHAPRARTAGVPLRPASPKPLCRSVTRQALALPRPGSPPPPGSPPTLPPAATVPKSHSRSRRLCLPPARPQCHVCGSHGP